MQRSSVRPSVAGLLLSARLAGDIDRQPQTRHATGAGAQQQTRAASRWEPTKEVEHWLVLPTTNAVLCIFVQSLYVSYCTGPAWCSWERSKANVSYVWTKLGLYKPNIQTQQQTYYNHRFISKYIDLIYANEISQSINHRHYRQQFRLDPHYEYAWDGTDTILLFVVVADGAQSPQLDLIRLTYSITTSRHIHSTTKLPSVQKK